MSILARVISHLRLIIYIISYYLNSVLLPTLVPTFRIHHLQPPYNPLYNHLGCHPRCPLFLLRPCAYVCASRLTPFPFSAPNSYPDPPTEPYISQHLRHEYSIASSSIGPISTNSLSIPTLRTSNSHLHRTAIRPIAPHTRDVSLLLVMILDETKKHCTKHRTDS